MDYEQFLAHIYERYSGNVKLGLERMYAILDAMGSPEKKLKGIHIAGTNGKGSTSAFCEALAISHKHKTGLNTSPHLVDYCERFRINGQNISLDNVLRIFHRWESVFTEQDASFFEITTAIAFYYFYEQKIDTAIIEVGLGGRLDGTNPFPSTVSVITTIGLDHVKTLGDTLDLIAFEKAGIIKEKTPVILGNIDKAQRKVILNVANGKKAPVYQYGTDFTASSIRLSQEGTVFNYKNHSMDVHFKDLTINMLGTHQAINATVALTAFIEYCQCINETWSEEDIRRALQHVNWQGRLQILQQKPTVLIDGAHNEEGVHSLVTNLKMLFPEKKLRFVLAILRDKKIDSMIEEICTIADYLYISKNQSDRAADIEEQELIAKKQNIPYETIETVVQAYLKALHETKEDEILVITGSLYTISEVLAYLQDSKK